MAVVGAHVSDAKDEDGSSRLFLSPFSIFAALRFFTLVSFIPIENSNS